MTRFKEINDEDDIKSCRVVVLSTERFCFRLLTFCYVVCLFFLGLFLFSCVFVCLFDCLSQFEQCITKELAMKSLLYVFCFRRRFFLSFGVTGREGSTSCGA